MGYWLDLIGSSELTRHKALVDGLEAGSGLGHGHATALSGCAVAHRDADGHRPPPWSSPRGSAAWRG